MSKKNLSRSAIEGGRSNYNKYERNESHRTERAIVREYCGKVEDDDEYFDHTVIKKRRKVGKAFHDKLGPMYRWLRSHVGQPWDDVRSKVHKLYDSRTIAGQHILYDHLLSSVAQEGEYGEYGLGNFDDFIVDANGILCLAERNRRAYDRNQRAAKYPGDWVRLSEKELLRWGGSRYVIDHGNVQYWTASPTRMSWRQCSHGDPPRIGYSCRYYPSKTVEVTEAKRNHWTHEWVNETRKERHCFSPDAATYAQGTKFTKEEAEFWKKLHPDQKKRITYDKDAWKKKYR